MGKEVAMYRNKLKEAEASGNWKWVMYELLKEEIHDISKYLHLYDLAMAEGKEDCANMYMNLAHGENDDALTLNSRYISMPYTSGTAEQKATWDEEYTTLMQRHSALVSRLTDRPEVARAEYAESKPMTWREHFEGIRQAYYSATPMEKQDMRLSMHKLID